MDKNIKVKPVNQYGVNHYNHNGKLTATARQVNWFFMLARVLDQESAEYTDIDDSCLLALTMSGHASWHNAEKRILWHCRLEHISLKDLKILPKVLGIRPRMTVKCDCESCIKCKLVQKPVPPRTFGATEPQQVVHSDLCSPLETAIRGC
jgi:hypothetical protein